MKRRHVVELSVLTEAGWATLMTSDHCPAPERGPAGEPWEMQVQRLQQLAARLITDKVHIGRMGDDLTSPGSPVVKAALMHKEYFEE